jgi:DNA topoisomerase-1
MPLDCRPQGPQLALEAGLSYADSHEPGIHRIRTKSGFAYRRPSGAPVRDEATLARIRSLAIPPAYTDVWICPDPNGHVQAVGRDARGRKQYRYHQRWSAHQNQTKYDRMIAFGQALPRLHARIEADLAHHGLPRDKVLAAVVRLLELTLIRVGNDEYARRNNSFGLTTLRKRHVDVSTAAIRFDFRGKSGKQHRTGIRDRRLARLVRACGDLPGQKLFQYLDDQGRVHAVESQHVNAYLHEAMGDLFTAKDFRTWAATHLAAELLAESAPPQSESHGRQGVAACVKAVALRLGNTPAVCRASYIHPAVLDAYAEGRLAAAFTAGRADRSPDKALLAFLEEAGMETDRRKRIRLFRPDLANTWVRERNT